MPLEDDNALIGDWNTDNGFNEPKGTDLRKEGDNQIRGAKGTIRRHFPNFVGTASVPKTVLASEDEINTLVGIGLTQPIVTLPVGAIMYFEAPATPGVGWVKKTDPAYDDVALRIVTGTPGIGGSLDFSTVFSRTATDEHILDVSQIPSHAHSYTGYLDNGNQGPGGSSAAGTSNQAKVTQANGGGLGHTHGMDQQVRYRDVYAAEFQGY